MTEEKTIKEFQYDGINYNSSLEFIKALYKDGYEKSKNKQIVIKCSVSDFNDDFDKTKKELIKELFYEKSDEIADAIIKVMFDNNNNNNK